MSDEVVIPHPKALPLNERITANGVQIVWETFVKPSQAAGDPQSIEDRFLMAILRAVYAGLIEKEFMEKTTDKEE